MANEEHLTILKQGTRVWERWREQHPEISPDLARANLSELNLGEANLSGANLSETDLGHSNLVKANLFRANLIRANLTGAGLAGANLTAAILGWANLRQANLWMANLGHANLIKADLSEANLINASFVGAVLSGSSLQDARLGNTVLANLDLGQTRHLDSCHHVGPSPVDYRTLQRSGKLPLSFLRGCGLSDAFIEYLPYIFGKGTEFHSCFIGYVEEDRALAERLFSDLQHEGVRCWHAPLNGRPRPRTVHEVVRLRERLVLLLSKNSVRSNWMADNILRALAEERRRNEPVLVPIRVDEAAIRSTRRWAAAMRRTHEIGDFRAWRDHAVYRTSFEKLLGDLRYDGTGQAAYGATTSHPLAVASGG